MKITTREKIILYLAIVFIGTLLFLKLFWEPLQEEKQGLRESLATSKSLLHQLEVQNEDYNILSEELVATEQGFIEASGAFPEVWNDSEIITYIERIIADVESEGEGHIVKNSLTFSGVQNNGDYCNGVFTLALSADYDDFYRFLKRLDDYEEKKEFFNNVSSVTVSEYSKDNNSIKGTIVVSFYALKASEAK